MVCSFRCSQRDVFKWSSLSLSVLENNSERHQIVGTQNLKSIGNIPFCNITVVAKYDVSHRILVEQTKRSTFWRISQQFDWAFVSPNGLELPFAPVHHPSLLNPTSNFNVRADYRGTINLEQAWKLYLFKLGRSSHTMLSCMIGFKKCFSYS